MGENADSGPGEPFFDSASDKTEEDSPVPILNEGSSSLDEVVIQRVLAEHKPSRNPFIRGLWVSFGSLAVIFAIIGIIVPGWPTTSWLVLAAYCYARSSQKLFRWLLTNRMFGPALLEYYRSGRALPLHSKMVISAIICVVSVASIWGITKAGDPGFGQTLIAVVALVGVWWVGWKVPTVA
ncbi:MAG: YbaN family protein [Candidatus Poseidoniaceae archaeon]|nr:YbaN family protein [Candidatus Poseidoniaceae archaeon]